MWLAAAQQVPKVGNIDLYGLGKVSKERVLHALKLHTGDSLPGSKGDMEDRVNEIPGVVAARVEAVCCEGADISLFIGIEERGGPHVAFRSEPAGNETLPEELTAAYHEFAGAVQRGAAQGQADRVSLGYQQRFAAFAEGHLDELRQVLRNAAESEERAVAAAVIGYAPNKLDVVNDLQYAIQDPDEFVRDNALRSLRAIALLAVKQPRLGIRISPTWLIELLNSLALSDRTQAVDVLITLTDTGDRAVLDQLRERALPSLVEMARWEALRYALPPFVLVGRLAGLSDEESQRSWSRGEREPVIDKALGRPPARQKKR